VLDIDEQREKALNVALNKITGEFDIPLLTDLLKDIGAGGFDVSLTGFDAAELDALFRDGVAAGIKEDDFDEPLPETPVSKQGDIWLLGRHRLICGDATKPEIYARLMDGERASLVVTDPPYNVDYKGKAGKLKNDDMESAVFHEFLLAAYRRMYDALADGGSIYVFHADRETASSATRPASGSRTRRFWGDAIINTVTNPSSWAGSRPQGITGMPTANSARRGTSTGRSRASITRR